MRDTTDPIVTIDYPSDGDYIDATTVTVTGTVDEATLQTVTVNGTEADLYGTYFVCEDVALDTEGSNTITVIATDAVSRTDTEAISVTRDTTDPTLTIDSPTNGSTVHTRWVTVTGTVESGVDYVVVNGAYVEPSDTSWTAEVLLDTVILGTSYAVIYLTPSGRSATLSPCLDSLAWWCPACPTPSPNAATADSRPSSATRTTCPTSACCASGSRVVASGCGPTA